MADLFKQQERKPLPKKSLLSDQVKARPSAPKPKPIVPPVPRPSQKLPAKKDYFAEAVSGVKDFFTDRNDLGPMSSADGSGGGFSSGPPRDPGPKVTHMPAPDISDDNPYPYPSRYKSPAEMTMLEKLELPAEPYKAEPGSRSGYIRMSGDIDAKQARRDRWEQGQDNKYADGVSLGERLEEQKLRLSESPLQAVVAASNMANDLHSRIADFRKSGTSDEPKYNYYLPGRDEPYTDDDIETVLGVDSDTYTLDEYNRPEEAVGFRIVADDDPTAMPGKTTDGQSWTADAFRMKNGKVIPREKYLNAEVVYRAFPDGTILELANGQVPVDVEGRIRKEQIDDGLLGWKATNPRFPWMDMAGNSPFVDEHYDPTDMVLFKNPGEALASGVDATLGSLPYMIPRYRYVAGAAKMVPAILGYDAEGMVTSGDRFGNLSDLGKVEYPDVELSSAQRLGGMIAPPVEAWSEMGISGKALGGVPKYAMRVPAISKLVKKFPVISSLVGSAATEAFEEAIPFPASVLARDGIKNYGADVYIDSNGATRHRPTDPERRWRNLAKEGQTSMLAGGMLGFGMGVPQGLLQAGSAARVKRSGIVDPKAPGVMYAPTLNKDVPTKAEE